MRASGKNSDGRKFHENTQTIVINAHGGLLYLQAPIALAAQLVLINPVTEEEQECRVVYLAIYPTREPASESSFFAEPAFLGRRFHPAGWPRGHPFIRRISAAAIEEAELETKKDQAQAELDKTIENLALKLRFRHESIFSAPRAACRTPKRSTSFHLPSMISLRICAAVFPAWVSV